MFCMRVRLNRPKSGRSARPGLFVATACVLVALAHAAETKPTTEPAAAPASTKPATAPATQPVSAPTGAKITDEGWFAPPQRSSPLPILPDPVTKAYVIQIREDITEKALAAVRRKLIQCKTHGAELIIVDMDTPGGLLFAGMDIAAEFKEYSRDVRIVCLGRNECISAGAVIALGCDEIVMTPLGRIGDAGIVYMGGRPSGLPPDKIETYARAEMRQSATLHGYNLALSQSMADPKLEVWLIRNKATRELRYVLSDDFSGRVTITPGVSDAVSNPRADWELLRIAVKKDHLLTMNTDEAIDYGFAAAAVSAPREAPYSGLAERYNVLGGFTVLEDTWSEGLVAFLTSPVVTGALFFVALVCGYMEINAPGFGVFGVLALICLALLVGSRYLIGLANWWEIGLLILGFALLAVELFITPGFGVMGGLGAVCCLVAIAGLLAANAPDELPWPKGTLDWSIFTDSAAAMLIGFIAAVFGMAVLARILPRTPLASRLLLAPARRSPADEAMSALGKGPIAVGQVGVVSAICRPAGRVRFADRLVDAVAEGEYIPAGAKVKVIRTEGNRVIVTRA